MEILKNMVVQQGNKMMEMEEPAAPPKMVTSGKDGVSLSVYGQVNRMLLNASDGSESRLFHADNDMSSTRVGFKGKAKMDGGWSAGTTIEAQMESNSSAKVHLGDDGDDSARFGYAKLGQKLDINPAGSTALSVGFMNAENADGDSGSYYDVAVVQKLKGLGAELYGIFGVYDAGIVGSSTNDITSTGVGGRIKF